MTRLITAIAVALFITPAVAATCADEGKDKKLAGAAMNSFSKKCVAERVGGN